MIRLFVVYIVIQTLFLNETLLSQNREWNKEVKKRCKLLQKEGFESDALLGSSEEQIRTLLKLEFENNDRLKQGLEEKWIIETVEVQSQDISIAKDKAKDLAIIQIAKKLAEKGKILSVYNGDLMKCKLIMRFVNYKNNIFIIKVTMAVDITMIKTG